MKELIRFLHKAARSGELITLAYGGGSRPGKARQLKVVSCTESDFRANERDSHKVKQYKIAKIIWAEDSSGARVVNDKGVEDFKSALPKLDTLQQYMDYLRPELESAGWCIHQENNMIGVGTRFKNGKPKKKPIISLQYFDKSTDEIWDLEKNELVPKKKERTGLERPWRVDSWRFKNGRSFGNLHSAIEVFIKDVRDSDPA